MNANNTAVSFCRFVLCGFRFVLFAAIITLAACGGSGSSEGSSASMGGQAGSSTGNGGEDGTDSGGEGEGEGETPVASELDRAVLDLANNIGLNGDPATPRGFVQRKPADDPLVHLGSILFFSQSLSGGFDSACATCHLPDMGGSDGLSLPVGVVAQDRQIAGPGRKINPQDDRDPLADGGPNMHRNSLTTFNAALYERSLMFDGRVRVSDTETEISPAGKGQAIVSPETTPNADVSGADGLLEVVSKFPMTNNNEMRGFYYSDISNHEDFRDHLAERLKGNVDQNYMGRDSAQNWLNLFRLGFSSPEASADDLINMLNIQKALASYVESQIFVETSWKHYLEGGYDQITDTAKRGAILFYTPKEQGGLGCASCHSGDRLTNEQFYNTAFPQIGRGFQRSDRTDVGRWQVTRADKDWFAFRVPSLLNVDVTAPYGHAGTFESLESVIAYHVNPRDGMSNYDFSLQQLPQFFNSGISYPNAPYISRYALQQTSYNIATQMLPMRDLSADEMSALVSFLRTLTDSCVLDVDCRRNWVPSSASDPDGHLLGADNGQAPVFPENVVTNPDSYPSEVQINWPENDQRSNFADIESGCSGANVANAGNPQFARKDQIYGLTATHGYDASTWSYANRWVNLEVTMEAGGVTSAYLDGDCWPDLIMTAGDLDGLVVYRNLGGGNGFTRDDSILGGTLKAQSYSAVTGVGVADLDGDYRRELILGNLHAGNLKILGKDAADVYQSVSDIPMTRSTFGMSFADTDNDGYLDMAAGHWDGDGVAGTAPAFWKGTGSSLLNAEKQVLLDSAYLDQKWNFTPKFADFRNVKRMDLVFSSDFGTSAVMQNNATELGFQYSNVTDRTVITDQNGMGGAIGDVDNDGKLDWFVTSIFDGDGVAEANWGVTGNRLYRNNSTPFDLSFEDFTEQSGVREGDWGWGACMADFNNDGLLDIFHVNGFGYIPEILRDDGLGDIIDYYASITTQFRGKAPHLFINQGAGTFEDKTQAWGLDVPSEGRGVTCFDYDHDGDIDIALLDHSKGLQFFENQIGSGLGQHYLSVRLVGESPNTDAIGARVYVVSDLGGELGIQRQMRMTQANSNFNGQDVPSLHFGLGEADRAITLRIEWPDNTGLICADVDQGGIYVFDQRDVVWPKITESGPLCTWYPDIVQVAFEALE